MTEISISKPLQKIFTDLTGEERFDVALHLATKDLVRLKLRETEGQIKKFEARYQMHFDEFKEAWENGQIADKYSYEVEKDYWEWKAALTDQQRLQEMLEKLP